MNRERLLKHVSEWITRLGTQTRVAEKCQISNASLSQWLNGKYGADTTEMDRQIATALSYCEDGWQVVPSIRNYQKIAFVYNSCKTQSMWMAISNKAGSGKTQTLQHLSNADLTGSVTYLQAEEWSARQFLLALAELTCGVPKSGYTDITTLIKLISNYFNSRASSKPLLIIDEADKLRPAALRRLIPLHNRTELRLGCLLAGTDNLRKEVEQGERKSTKGYDEIYSRLGRSFISLPGASEADVMAICAANALPTETATRLWNEVEKVKRLVKVQNKRGEVKERDLFFCEDLRRLMRLIKREQLAEQFSHLNEAI